MGRWTESLSHQNGQNEGVSVIESEAICVAHQLPSATASFVGVFFLVHSKLIRRVSCLRGQDGGSSSPPPRPLVDANKKGFYEDSLSPPRDVLCDLIRNLAHIRRNQSGRNGSAEKGRSLQ